MSDFKHNPWLSVPLIRSTARVLSKYSENYHSFEALHECSQNTVRNSTNHDFLYHSFEALHECSQNSVRISTNHDFLHHSFEALHECSQNTVRIPLHRRQFISRKLEKKDMFISYSIIRTHLWTLMFLCLLVPWQTGDENTLMDINVPLLVSSMATGDGVTLMSKKSHNSALNFTIYYDSNQF